MDSPAGEVYLSKAKNKSLVANIWSHDIAQRLRIRRKIMAKDAGLGELDGGTYPSNGAVYMQDQGGFWKGIFVAALAAGGLGMASGLFQLPLQATAPVQQPQQPAASVQEWDLEVISVDGKPVVRGRRAETE